jgi:hypothetical protein
MSKGTESRHKGWYVSRLSIAVKDNCNKQLKRRKSLHLFMVSELSVHGHSSPSLWTYGKDQVVKQSCPPQGGQQAKKIKRGQGPNILPRARCQ